MSRFVQGLAVVALLVGGVWPVVADHPQTSADGKFTTFDHRGGNEWWVEVGVDTSADLYIVHVEESDGNGMALQENEWGNWVGSLHIEPGHMVRFSANARDGSGARVSCWFTHPGGVEQCSSTPPPPPPPSDFDATFTLVTGNANWVQSQVTPSSGLTVATVDVRLNDGAWKPLKLQSWGVRAWAASYPIPEGTVVQMRATATTGASDLSECYRWIPPQGNNGENAATVACGSTPPPPPPDPTWTASLLGPIGISHGSTDIAVGDARGQREIFVPSKSGLFRFTWTSSGWQGQNIRAGNMDHVAVGDLRGNGGTAVFVSSYDATNNVAAVDMVWFARVEWPATRILTIPGAEVTGLSLGDVEDGGMKELYVITGNPHSPDNSVGYNVYQVKPDPASPNFIISRVATSQAPTVRSGFGSLWVGDGDNDGQQELYAAQQRDGAGVWRIDAVGSTWSIAQIGSPPEAISANAIVVGDPNHDGKQAVYVSALGSASPGEQDAIWEIRMDATSGWTQSRIFVTAYDYREGLKDLFYGDADHNGQAELYATRYNGHLTQISWSGTQWTSKDIADLHAQLGGTDQLGDMAIGDGDNDGRLEVYATGFSLNTPDPAGNVYRIGTMQPTPPPPPGNFGATFTMVQGNVWWQQAQVTPSGEALSTVDVSLNGGAWQPLKLQTWGVREYAGSYHAVQGTIVQLRATSTTGATALSSCYQWIPASGQDASQIACGSTPPPPPPPSGFDATFTGVKGNDWWVQTNVAANQPLDGVDVRVNCAPSWKPLTKQSWGGWTASFNIPAGSKVDFAARSTSGAADASGGYTWPQATATSGCALGVWPQQGSFATYNIHHAMGGDGQTFVTDARLNLAYNGGAWTGICTGRSTHFGNDGETSVDWTATVNGQPPLNLPAATSVGARHGVAHFFPSYDGHTCDLRTSDFPAVTVRRQEDRATSLQDSNGAPITLRAWYADEPVDAEHRYVAAWDTKLGLVLDWDHFGRGSSGGDLVATDAPVQ